MIIAKNWNGGEVEKETLLQKLKHCKILYANYFLDNR